MIVFVGWLIRFALWVDQVLLKFDSGCDGWDLFAEDNPVPALEPCKHVSVVNLL